MTLSVEEQLHLAEYHRQAAHTTLCRTCEHRYIDHEHDGRCWWPRVHPPAAAYEPNCRCKSFADPAIYPPAEQLALEPEQ